MADQVRCARVCVCVCLCVGIHLELRVPAVLAVCVSDRPCAKCGRPAFLSPEAPAGVQAPPSKRLFAEEAKSIKMLLSLAPVRARRDVAFSFLLRETASETGRRGSSSSSTASPFGGARQDVEAS